MGILDKISCPVCGGMGAQLRNKQLTGLGTPSASSITSSGKRYSARTIACKHCDAELDDRPEGDLTKTYIREALKERKGDPEGKYLSRKPTRRVN